MAGHPYPCTCRYTTKPPVTKCLISERVRKSQKPRLPMHDPLLTACTLASVLGALAGPDGKQGGEQPSGVCSRRLHGTTLNTSEKKKARSTGCAVQQDRSQAHARADAQMFYRAAESAFALQLTPIANAVKSGARHRAEGMATSSHPGQCGLTSTLSAS